MDGMEREHLPLGLLLALSMLGPSLCMLAVIPVEGPAQFVQMWRLSCGISGAGMAALILFDTHVAAAFAWLRNLGF